MSQNQEKIILRRASPDDSDFLFSLRNDPVVISTSTSGAGVEINEHLRWLARVCESDAHLLCIIESRDSGERVGYSRLDRRDSSDAIMTIAIVEEWRSRSIGRSSIAETARLGFEHWQEVNCVLAYVKAGNKASESAFLHGGFRLHDKPDKEGHHLYSIERSISNA